MLWAALAGANEARAQEPETGLVAQGDLVISGFSGKVAPPAAPPLPAGTSELDETLIDVGGASIKVLDVSAPGGGAEAQVINAPVKFQVSAGEIGQVFGLAMDDASPRNIYATATPVHGLQIVLPDADGDGRPERLKLGQPGAQWMDGQFGIAKGGGPGSVWKIDGATGEVSLFANIGSAGAPAGGSGLGNIAYDGKHKQFYVSDLATGLIHRLDMTGNDLGTFDHGVAGRPANALDAVADDPANKLDITSPAFDSEDPDSWGFTDTRRRVWGLAYHGGRLYYAVADGPQIWSVGIAEDGSFAGDPRWELDVAAGSKRHPVSDIAFAKGEMI
ncbi:MAG: hypothetical protein OEM91_16145, partial [Hyphomicrobiales bacterium]|nr:hypothetical protein [Hyphomicrobiales bacterium]